MTPALALPGFAYGEGDCNVERIKRQNRRKISVIIGNPPYSANQLNENENNKNREYPDIDKRIKETYIKESTAQKTKLYDMYARFFRWASDRVDENGVVAFISNRSFIESRTFDGFRKVVGREFNEIHIVDLGGDVRANPKLSGTKHNVFGIQTGVAISFLVKRKKAQGCRIFYSRRPELETAEEKLAFLGEAKLPRIVFDEIRPDANHNWINLTQNDFETLTPSATRATKATKLKSQEHAIFKLFSLGVVTARDEWMYDFSQDSLKRKVTFLIETYNRAVIRIGSVGATKTVVDSLDYSIKWTRGVKRDLGKGLRYDFSKRKIIMANYRPVVTCWLYRDNHLNEMPNLTQALFGDGVLANRAITVMGDSSGKPYFSLAIDRIPDLNFVSPASGGSQTLPLWRCDASGERVDNITDWALDQFRKHYSAVTLAKAGVQKARGKASALRQRSGADDDPDADLHSFHRGSGDRLVRGSTGSPRTGTSSLDNQHTTVRPELVEGAMNGHLPVLPSSEPGTVAEGVARRGGLRRRGAAAASTDGGPQRQDPGGDVPAGNRPITKEDIFRYVYGVLHDPVYRDKYALNLKREFPRIPFYPDFRQRANWGKELKGLHIGYETVEPWKLTRTDVADDGHTPKAMLKADKENGRILLDSRTVLSGIPPDAWTYKFGNRSALEWILDQYKEKKPKDPTIREKFNTYRFADYKEKVIDLLQRVTTVSVRTQAVVAAMRTATR